MGTFEAPKTVRDPPFTSPRGMRSTSRIGFGPAFFARSGVGGVSSGLLPEVTVFEYQYPCHFVEHRRNYLIHKELSFHRPDGVHPQLARIEAFWAQLGAEWSHFEPREY